MERTLRIDYPDGRVETSPLPPDRDVLLGRDASNHVVLEAPDVSRRHLVLRYDGQGWVITDTSANGTFVGTHRLRGQAAYWPDNVPLYVGRFTLHLLGDEVPAEQARAPQPTQPPPPGSSSGLRPGKPESETPTGRDAGFAIPVELRRRMHAMLLDHLDLAGLDGGKLDAEALRPKVRAALRRITTELASELPAGADPAELIDELANEVLGLGPLEALLADPEVSEIMVVDPETIYVERNGRVNRTPQRFTDASSVRAIIERIVTPLGRRIDESTPVVDARLRDGSRVHAIIPPLVVGGPCITIRKFASIPFTVEDLVGRGSWTAAMARFLVRCVKARKSILVAGGTGTGKTTLLNVLSGAIPPGERILTIEDAAELDLEQPHVVSLESRQGNIEGRGEYSIRELVRNALRMRPDRIVVGEVRGGEALDMLQAMNTGHEGSLTTVHANSPEEALERVETLALMGGVDLGLDSVRRQIASAIDLIVHQERFSSDGSRRVTRITEVVGLEEDGNYERHDIFAWKQTGIGASGEPVGEFQATGYLPTFLSDFITLGLVTDGEYL